MTIPIWVLLGFAAWTLVLLITTVGIYRWSHILSGRANLVDFPADKPEGKPVYLRAMRAHANCIENLPVYASIVFVAYVARLNAATLDYLAIAVLSARIAQSCTHVIFPITNTTVAFRFAFFFIQAIAMFWMAGFIVYKVLFLSPPV